MSYTDYCAWNDTIYLSSLYNDSWYAFKFAEVHVFKNNK